MCRNADEDGDFGHIGGLTVRDFSDVPPELSRVRIPARRHAVFARRGHVSAVCGTIDAIWNKWLPVSGRIVADAPSFERYDRRFDPRTGMGGFEIWIPIEG